MGFSFGGHENDWLRRGTAGRINAWAANPLTGSFHYSATRAISIFSNEEEIFFDMFATAPPTVGACASTSASSPRSYRASSVDEAFPDDVEAGAPWSTPLLFSSCFAESSE